MLPYSSMILIIVRLAGENANEKGVKNHSEDSND
jgi:hypothetical protein